MPKIQSLVINITNSTQIVQLYKTQYIRIIFFSPNSFASTLNNFSQQLVANTSQNGDLSRKKVFPNTIPQTLDDLGRAGDKPCPGDSSTTSLLTWSSVRRRSLGESVRRGVIPKHAVLLLSGVMFS